MSRVHPPERLDQPRDRPEHPPVWVRGGPASYYYSPNKPHVATADEAARRQKQEAHNLTPPDKASTSSISSTTGSPPDTRSSSFSFPTTAFPTTMAGSTTTGRSGSTSSTESTTSRSGSQSETISAGAASTSTSTGRSRSGSGPGYLASLFSSGNQPMEHPAAAVGRKGSPSSGRPAFSGLRSQKRESSDPTYVQRRESWREQTFKPGGDRRFVGKWWDNVIRGDRDSK